MDSCPRRRSERSRPCRNSFRASDDLVVIGILPSAVADASIFFGPLEVAHAALLNPATRTATTHADFWKSIELPPSVCDYDASDNFTLVIAIDGRARNRIADGSILAVAKTTRHRTDDENTRRTAP